MEKLEIKWPWTMLPTELAEEYIAFLKKRIGPGHPLHNKKVFPGCRREDTEDLVVQYDNDDDDTHWIVYFDEPVKIREHSMPRAELVGSFDALIKRVHQDHVSANGG